LYPGHDAAPGAAVFDVDADPYATMTGPAPDRCDPSPTGFRKQLLGVRRRKDGDPDHLCQVGGGDKEMSALTVLQMVASLLRVNLPNIT